MNTRTRHASVAALFWGVLMVATIMPKTADAWIPAGNVHSSRSRSYGVDSALHSSTTASSSSTPTSSKDDNKNEEAAATARKSDGSDRQKEEYPNSPKFADPSKPKVVDRLSMPWSVNQDWALRDNLPKFTVVIPLEESSRDQNNEEQTHVFALWRTMLNEVPELAGYPIDFLQEMHSVHVDANETKIQVTPRLLPYLDEYTFTSAGGVSGKVHGVPGLADGTRIETSTVTNIEVTLPQGFLRTSDGKAAYELGRPQREDFTENKASDLAKTSLATAQSGSYAIMNSINGVTQNAASTSGSSMEDADGMLVRLGASTGILLAGATALNMLSHHLTVNVFWV